MASVFFMMWFFPSFLNIFFLFTLYPGLSKVTQTSSPSTPSFGSYSIFGMSMYSFMPKEKFPVLSKLLSFRLFSRAASILFRNSFMLLRIVVLHPMALFFGTLKVVLFFVLVITTLDSDILSSICFATSSGVSVPHPIFSVIFSILISIILLIFNHRFLQKTKYSEISKIFHSFQDL